ncbi:MAG: hypothetical protein ACRCYU_22155 [Nocardioides sp.]
MSVPVPVSVSIIDAHPLFRDPVAGVVQRTEGMDVEQAVGTLSAFHPCAEVPGSVVVINPMSADATEVGEPEVRPSPRST